MKILRAEGLGKSYNHRDVIKGVSIEIQSAQIVGLLGPNGSGKTTCFNMIAGIIAPDSGRIFFQDLDISSFPVHKRAKMGISYLPQEPSIFHNLSVADNILAVLELQNISKKQQKETMNSLLEDFKIHHLHKAMAGSLSGGERRRLEIAKTIAMKPKLILLDEPFVGIDPIAIEEIQDIILNLKNQGISCLITDHSVHQAMRVIDICYVMYNGEIIVGDIKQNVVNNPRVRELYLGANFNY